MSQMQFRENPDDLTGIPKAVTTPDGKEICHHQNCQMEMITSTLLPPGTTQYNTRFEMVNAIYLG